MRRITRQIPGRGAAIIGLGLAAVGGCRAQRSGDGAITERPAEIVVWADPLTGGMGETVRDANNDAERSVVIGTGGEVQFLPDGTICTDCAAEGATIDVGGDFIDIRFGVGATGDTERRAFLVDRASGNFIQLVGGGSGNVTFQVTEQPFEGVNDSSDDLAVAAGTADNPLADGGSSGGAANPLCGALGGGILPLLLAGLCLLMPSSTASRSSR